jgi:hypothetical protein
VRARRLQLAELVDIELQLLRDHGASREELRRRDRRIGVTIDASERARSSDPAERAEVLRGWVRAVGEELGQESAGERMVRAYHALGWLLALLGLSSGAGAAATVLSYDGTHPVNVVHFLAVFVAGQAALLLLFALSTVIWRLRDRLPAVGGLHGLLRWALDAVSGLLERRLSAERRTALRAARGRLRSTQWIYGDLERWLLVSLAQRFGLAFNLGALAACLYLVAFSDLAFAWQTTLSTTAEGFHRLLSVLAAPWSWALPDALPTLDVVHATRYFRLGGSFARAAPAETLGQWWPFLVMSLLCYGLAPRLGLAVVASAKLRMARGALRLDHGDIVSLLERLASPLVRTHAPVPELGPLDVPAPQPQPASGPAPASGGAAVVIWGGVPIEPSQVKDLVDRRFGWTVGTISHAGDGEVSRDTAAIQSVGDGREPVVVIGESFESPTREVREFLRRLREAIGADRPVVVGLVDSSEPPAWSEPSPKDLRPWHKHLAQLADPYLRVEALVERS